MLDAFERLSFTIQNKSKAIAKQNSKIQLEIGTITGGYGLKVARFDSVIPRSEYLINKRLAFDYEDEKEWNTQPEQVKLKNICKGIHEVEIGDMVLVAWVGNDPIIIAVLVNGSEIE